MNWKKSAKAFFFSCMAGLVVGIISELVTGEFLPDNWFIAMAIVQIIVYQACI